MTEKKGISLIEIIISIAIIGGTIAVFGSLLNIMRLNKTGTFYTNAYKIAQEELEAVRAISFEYLEVCTSSTFINTLYNNGSPGAESGAIKIIGSQAQPGVALLPYNQMADFELETEIKSSALPQESGLILRARDLENYYFFYITENKIAFDKIINGLPSNLYEQFQSFSPDTYYKLRANISGEQISLYLNDNPLGTINDSELSQGFTAIASQNSITYFDNTELIYNSQTYNWNFNSLTEGELPEEWQRFGIEDLPNGFGTLTISEPYGTPSIKQIDVSVSWHERGETKSINLSTLRSE